MSVLESFGILAQYNKRMNRHFYGLCDSLPDAKRKQEMGAFFNSIHGTLNHLLLGDKIWMSRFLQAPFEVESLDQEVHSDYHELQHERFGLDTDICRYINSLNESTILETITFTSLVQKNQHTFILKDCLLHFFNHQTHHRGQLSALISQLGVDIGVTDLLWMPGLEKT